MGLFLFPVFPYLCPMSFELTGKLIVKLELQSGTSARGDWKKQGFVLQTEEQYPKTIAFEAWGERVDDLSSASLGSMLKVSFEPESREWQGKYFTQLRAYKIANLSGASQPEPAHQPAQVASNPAMVDDDLPF